MRLRFLGRRRIEGPHLCARVPQRLEQHAARRLAHVVRAGLESQAPDREGLAREIAAVVLRDLLEQHLLLRLVDGLDRIEQRGSYPTPRAERPSACTSFGKQEPPYPRPG